MSFLIVDGERYALQIGETTLGGTADELMAMSSLASLPPFAVITTPPEGAPTIAHVDGAPPLEVDGQPVGTQPVPLVHGSRLEVRGKRFVFGDLRSSGRTAATSDVEEDVPEGLTPEVAVPTAATGGRLIPRNGGGAFSIPDDGITIGRDPDNTLVLTSAQASRRHARITPTLLGYTISDSSANGVFINGRRVESGHRLGFGDVVRFGEEEFIFEADAASFEPDPSATPAPATTAPRPAPRPPLIEPATVPSAASRRVTSPAAAAPGQQARTLLATLEVISEGPMKGRRFRIETPIVHLGRADYNEIQIPEDSVSAAHAMLIQRSGRWQVTDLESRNGTYVDGDRVTETALPEACDLRLGNVKMIFRRIAAGSGRKDSTKGIVSLADEQTS